VMWAQAGFVGIAFGLVLRKLDRLVSLSSDGKPAGSS
jgi:hypothetical protein